MRIFILTFLCGIQIHRNQALQPKLEIDCQPNLAVSKENCDRVGCVWNSAKNKPGPKCYFKNGKKKMTGYDVLNSQISATVWSANLIRRNTPSLFGSDVRRLSLLMEALTESHFYIKITDSLNETFQVPHRTARLNIERLRKSKASQNCTLPYEVTLHDSPFGITVTRLATGTRIFDSANIPGFIFSKKFLQMTTRLPSVFLYGLGEHNHEFLRHDLNWKKYGFFNRDNAPRFGENTNLYGYHPFYLCLEPGGVSHGVVFFTSHAMNIELQPGPALTFRAIGGQLEIHIFMGPSPDEVIQQYLGLVGEFSIKFVAGYDRLCVKFYSL